MFFCDYVKIKVLYIDFVLSFLLIFIGNLINISVKICPFQSKTKLHFCDATVLLLSIAHQFRFFHFCFSNIFETYLNSIFSHISHFSEYFVDVFMFLLLENGGNNSFPASCPQPTSLSAFWMQKCAQRGCLFSREKALPWIATKKKANCEIARHGGIAFKDRRKEKKSDEKGKHANNRKSIDNCQEK